MSRLPLRVRLVAGFVVAMLVVLTGAGAFVYWRVQYALDNGLNGDLDRATSTIIGLVSATGALTSPETADATGAGWQVIDDTGRVVDSGATASDAPLVPADTLDHLTHGTLTKDVGALFPATAQSYRAQITALPPGQGYLVVAVSRDRRDEALRELLLQLTLAGAAALAIAAVVGDLLARAALRPVERYRIRASEIAGGAADLSLDVPTRRNDEVTRLGHTLNEMLTALHASLEHERRFVNDASHELRTPLTVLTSRLQLARRRPRTVNELEKVLDELLVDVARLSELADDLLTLGAQTSTIGQADAADVALAVAQGRSSGSEDRYELVRLRLPSGPAQLLITPRTAERILTNLVDNAFLHGATPVDIRVMNHQPGWTIVEVSDAGDGMLSPLLAEATERFARAPEARTRPGAGLGLSIVEQMVAQSCGELRLCFDALHASHGEPHPEVLCSHDARMTATVILPTRSTV